MSALERPPVDVEAPAPVAPWYPPPNYPPPNHPPPRGHAQGSGGGRAVSALVAAIAGIVLGLPFGIPGMILGTAAYFLGKSALSRMEGSGAHGGRGVAVSAWVLGVVAMAIGSAVTLVWLVILLVATSGPTAAG